MEIRQLSFCGPQVLGPTDHPQQKAEWTVVLPLPVPRGHVDFGKMGARGHVDFFKFNLINFFFENLWSKWILYQSKAKQVVTVVLHTFARKGALVLTVLRPSPGPCFRVTTGIWVVFPTYNCQNLRWSLSTGQAPASDANNLKHHDHHHDDLCANYKAVRPCFKLALARLGLQVTSWPGSVTVTSHWRVTVTWRGFVWTSYVVASGLSIELYFTYLIEVLLENSVSTRSEKGLRIIRSKELTYIFTV